MTGQSKRFVQQSARNAFQNTCVWYVTCPIWTLSYTLLSWLRGEIAAASTPPHAPPWGVSPGSRRGHGGWGAWINWRVLKNSRDTMSYINRLNASSRYSSGTWKSCIKFRVCTWYVSYLDMIPGMIFEGRKSEMGVITHQRRNKIKLQVSVAAALAFFCPSPGADIFPTFPLHWCCKRYRVG